jgi:two-component system heavy metal sensor histidine kinase CusS
MFSKRTEPRSIATQLVLLFTLCATLLLSCGLGVLYWIVVQHAVEEDNVVLTNKVLEVHETLRQPGGIDTIKHELKTLMPGGAGVYWVRVIDPDGNAITETPGMENLLPATAFPSPRQFGMQGWSITNYRVGELLFSLTATLDLVGDRVYTIQVAQDVSADERFRKQFRALLTLVLGASVIASALIAVTVTRRGLRPLAEMKRVLERVEPAHLNERIDPGRWPSELRPVAASFDDMLGRLEDSFTRLSQFSADLAHELRTPIGNMLGEAQVALTRKRTPDEYRTVIESAAAECERLSGIIDNLLFLARAESAEQQINRALFNARTELEKIISFYQTLAEERRVKISCSGDAEIFADPILLNRAIGNLIDNALRFTPENGSIRVGIRAVTNGVEISVTDTGTGIAADHLPRVFDRFYRADPSRSSAGTGLGLALVKSIVDLHGGSVSIESQLGRGTTVALIFLDKA